MSFFLILLQLISFQGWAVEQAEVPEYQSSIPIPIGAAFATPSLGHDGFNLPSQLDPSSVDREAFLAKEDALLKNDPLLGQDSASNVAVPVSLRTSPDQSQLPERNVEAVGSQSKKKNSFIKVNSFSELKHIVGYAGSIHGVQSAQVQWDGATDSRESGEQASERTPLTARGPPEITIVRNAAEVERAIPNTPTLRQFREQLQEKFWRNQIDSVRVYSYLGAKGGRITTVDVSHSPALVEILPGLYPHERRLVQKLIASGAKQIQIALIEGDGQSESTPDLVLEGRMAEMKSIGSDNATHDFMFFLNKANAQLYKHAERHGLGLGTAVIDLVQGDYVPVADVLSVIKAWEEISTGQKIPSPYKNGHLVIKYPVAMDRIDVFAQHDHKVFTRKADGSFELEESSKRP